MRKADWLIGALIAALVLFGAYYFMKAYNKIKSEEPNRPSVEETLDKMGDGTTATLDEEDEFEDEDGMESDTLTYESEEPTIDDLADLNRQRVEAEEAADARTNVPREYDATTGGKFLVVAGTFKQEANAQAQLKKFQRMGYNDAEIGTFNRNAYASLIVARFATSADANRLVKSLKAKGIDAYVHKKR